MMKTVYCRFVFTFILCCGMLAPAWAETVVLAVPGPASLTYLPVYLAKAIAADRAEGLELKLQYVAGGPIALRSMRDRNSDFAVVGLPAIADARAAGAPIVALGQLSQSAMYVFLLRSDLKGKVRQIADLKGLKIGTTNSTNSNRSMGFMMTEYLIIRAGLRREDVQFVPIGQSRESQRSALSSALADATLGDEPFASELLESGIAVKLADLYSPHQSSTLLGGAVIHASLASREEILQKYPGLANRVLRTLDRALQWMAQHTPQEVVDKLEDQPGFDKIKKPVMVEILRRNHGMFTQQTAWDSRAVENTERFFHAVSDEPEDKKLKFSDFVRTVGVY